MENLYFNSWPLALVRAIHYSSCLLAFGIIAFDLLIAAPALKDRPIPPTIGWSRTAARLLWVSLFLAILSGAAWLAINAVNMSGLSVNEALKPPVLGLVLNETHFGQLWKIRGLLFLGAIAAALLRIAPPARGAATWIALLLFASVVASLAWSGHGQDGNHPQWHLAADALHLLIGGIWPVGLLPFTLLFLKLRRASDEGKWVQIGRLTRRFSAASLISVALLAGTGIVNSFFMLDSPSDLYSSDYGKVLSAKIIVFLAMIGFGAVNLLRWKPRISAEYNDRTPAAAARLQLNVAVESFLSLAVLVLVGFLGTLAPPMGNMMQGPHHHHHMDADDSMSE